MKLISVNQAVARAVMTYPSLYGGHSYELSRALVFDQIFNVIGNGIRSLEEFLQEFAAGPGTENLPEMPAQWLVDGTLLGQGFEKYTTIGRNGGREYKTPDCDSLIVKAAREEDQALYPQVALWQEIIPTTSLCPYPNFAEKYSIYHRIGDEGRSLLGRDWLEAVDWFYGQCQDYFMGDCSDYHRAHPGAEGEDRIARFMEYIQELRTPEMSDKQFFEHISNECDQTYSGDPEAFLTEGWRTEKARILQFISDTRKMVAVQLDAMPEPSSGVISGGPRM